MTNAAQSKNNIKIYSYTNEHLHSFCICFYIKTGSMYETKDTIGISHFLEHMIFRNINFVSGYNLYETLDNLGLAFSASTCKEFVQFSITGAPRKFKSACDIITKIFLPLDKTLPKDEFEAERKRIKAEIREDDDKRTIEYIAKSSVWENTSLANLITGTIGNVNKIKMKHLAEEKDKVFSASNVFCYVTGNVPQENMKYLAEKISEYEISENGVCRNNIAPVPENFFKRNCKVVTKQEDYCMAQICFDVDNKKVSKEERSILYDMIFSGDSCAMFRELSEKYGYVYSYDARLEEYRNIGSLSFSFEVEYKNLYSSLEAVAEICEKMKETPQGLEKAKVYYTDNIEMMLDNAEELNFTMAYENYILNENFDTIEKKKEKYLKINEENIKKASREIFRNSNLVVAVKGDKKKINAEKIKKIFAKLN